MTTEVAKMGFIERYRDMKQYRRFSKLLIADRNAEAEALFPQLNLSNGPKQIAMVNFGNALMRLDKYGRAISAYEDAIASEASWGGRKKKANSDYIIAYCEFFAEVARSRLENRKFEDWQKRVVYMDCLPVSKTLKQYTLPLPSYLG